MSSFYGSSELPRRARLPGRARPAAERRRRRVHVAHVAVGGAVRGVGLGQAVCRSCSPSAISSTSLSQNAGRSLGTRLLTRPLSTTTSSSTQVAPALDRSVFRLG